MDKSLSRALQVLVYVFILFLIAIVVWLFCCRCHRLPWRKQSQTYSQPSFEASAPPNRVSGHQYPPFSPPEKGYNEDRPRAVPTGPLRGTLAPTVSRAQLFQIQNQKQNPPLGGSADPVVFSGFNSLGTQATGVGTPPDVNTENSGSYFWRDVAINSWPNGTISSTDPDGTNWLSFAFPGSAVLGLTRRTGNEVWFAWTGSSNANFKNPQVQVLEINPSDYSVISQWQIWNDDYAFTYPSLTTNSNGEVGISLGWGGRSYYGNNAVGILGDFVVWYPELSTISNSSRYGDYFNVARNTPNSPLFDASGYAVLKNTPPAVGQRFDPYYIQFGRNSIVNGGAPGIK